MRAIREMRPLPARSDAHGRHRDTPSGGADVRTSPAQADHATSMLTGLLLWLCTLPLIGLLVLPWFGPRVAVGVAVALLVATVTACYALCGWQRQDRREITGHE